MKVPYATRYPRKVLLRAFLRRLVRFILFLTAKTEITGLERIPKTGPVILAGNHVAVMEIVMMLAYAPRQVEFVGAGDIPLDPTFAPFANLYGFIPLQRGMIDRAGMRVARDVLSQNGCLVVFPEGGIWEPAGMTARLGVAWLSQEAQAPVVPVGFGGMQGALKKMMRFQRPQLVMNVGNPIPPAAVVQVNENRRERLAAYARTIFEQIQRLIPETERSHRPAKVAETFRLQIYILAGEENLDCTDEIPAGQQQGLARFLCQPVLLDALRRNLQLDVAVLQHLDAETDAAAIAAACQTVLRYLETNSGFLVYRFGIEEGLAAAEGLRSLAHLAGRAVQQRQGLSIQAVHCYRETQDGPEVCVPFGRKVRGV
ncbi:MAG TPA: lysophospholipid acyltransferase family protein [Anaerolineaceae bacterium]|nr:lysophospholipid acyltransferase family protein [Anaerolineaceae bacterium]